MRIRLHLLTVLAAITAVVAGVAAAASAQPAAPSAVPPTASVPARPVEETTTGDTNAEAADADDQSALEVPIPLPRPVAVTTPTAPVAVAAAVEVAPSDGLVRPQRSEEAVQIGPPLPPPPPSDEDLPANSGTGRRVVYSIKAQRVWAVDETETVVKTHRISGRMDSPARGTYHVYSRSLSTCAEHNPAICWRWMVRFAWGPNGGSIGFHEIPFNNGRAVQTVEQLGQPLSGGCVRQSVEDAQWMWDWAQLGTTVVVL